MLRACCFLALLGVVLCGPAHAHRVNVFAWIEGGDVVVEGSFSRGNPARGAAVDALAQGLDAPVFQGKTDAAGLVRFPLPAQARGRELRIVLNAGEGHRNEWLLTAEETGVQEPAHQKPAPLAASEPSSPPSPQPAPQDPALVDAHLKALVAEAVRTELAPMQRQLSELQRDLAQPGPSVQDIIAGIGFLFGLAGVAMLVKGRR